MKIGFMETYCMTALLAVGILVGILIGVSGEVPEQGEFVSESFTFQEYQVYPPIVKGFRVQ